MKQTFHAFVLSALLATCLNTAHAQSDASAVSMLSAMPIASIVAETGASAKDASALPAAFSLAGATLSIVAVEASATGTVYVLERVSDGARASERVYDAIWRDGLEAASRVGGTISHHHGVGLLKGPHMRSEHREAFAILAGLKRALDPDDLMNPGKLGLAAPRWTGARP